MGKKDSIAVLAYFVNFACTNKDGFSYTFCYNKSRLNCSMIHRLRNTDVLFIILTNVTPCHENTTFP